MRVMVTGGNRGIGLELVRRYVSRGDRVVATYRAAGRSRELLDMASRHRELLSAVRLDVTDEASIDACFGEVSGLVDGLDVLVNNAGVGAESLGMGRVEGHNRLGALEGRSLLSVLHVNAVSPLLVTQRFLPLLGRGSRVVHVSSQMGSIGNRSAGGHYSYCASKAALNMYGRILAIDLRGLGIASVMLHPGWVRTDLGGAEAPLSVEESVDGMVLVIDSLTMADSGGFLDYNGEPVPW